MLQPLSLMNELVKQENVHIFCFSWTFLWSSCTCTSAAGRRYYCRPEITLYCTSVEALTSFNCKVFSRTSFPSSDDDDDTFFWYRFNFFFFFSYCKPHCISEQSSQKLKKPVIFNFNVSFLVFLSPKHPPKVQFWTGQTRAVVSNRASEQRFNGVLQAANVLGRETCAPPESQTERWGTNIPLFDQTLPTSPETLIKGTEAWSQSAGLQPVFFLTALRHGANGNFIFKHTSSERSGGKVSSAREKVNKKYFLIREVCSPRCRSKSWILYDSTTLKCIVW